VGGKEVQTKKKKWVMVEQEKKNQPVLTSLVNVGMKK
jgi:hypothetical protein